MPTCPTSEENTLDPLDFAIYRFLSPRGEARFWAGRLIVDPEVPAREIAEQVGISENGVRARLRRLAQKGFLRGRSVVPNPCLFGVRVYVADLPVDSAAQVEPILRDLALVEGVGFARDTMDEIDRLIRVYFVADTETVANRRASLIRRLSPKGQLGPPRPYWIPPCTRELSRLDWKVLQTICQLPNASIAEIAGARGISLKTAAARYHQLLNSRACWWTHGPDSEEFPLAFIQVDVKDEAHRDSVSGTILREGQAWMPVANDGLGLEPHLATTVVAGLVPADAPTVLERMVRNYGRLAGVVGVRRTFALGSAMYPAWFTERVSERVSAGS